MIHAVVECRTHRRLGDVGGEDDLPPAGLGRREGPELLVGGQGREQGAHVQRQPYHQTHKDNQHTQ